MPKENIYQTRRILPSKLTVIVAGTSEELTVPENHFSLSDEEKILSRLQLFAKKAKTFYFDKR